MLLADGYEEIRKAPVLTYLVGRSPFSDQLFFFFRSVVLTCQKSSSLLSEDLFFFVRCTCKDCHFSEIAHQFH